MLEMQSKSDTDFVTIKLQNLSVLNIDLGMFRLPELDARLACWIS